MDRKKEREGEGGGPLLSDEVRLLWSYLLRAKGILTEEEGALEERGGRNARGLIRIRVGGGIGRGESGAQRRLHAEPKIERGEGKGSLSRLFRRGGEIGAGNERFVSISSKPGVEEVEIATKRKGGPAHRKVNCRTHGVS